MKRQGGKSHAGEARGASEKRIRWALVLTCSFMAVEMAGGIISGSLALLADAGHMLTDAASLAIALSAFRFSRRRPDEAKTYGYHRAHVLAAFVNGLALLGISAGIFYEAFLRLWQPVRVLSGTMLAVALAGLAINLAALRILRGASPENLSIYSALMHVLGDLLGSLAAIAAAGVIMATGWYPIDPILSCFIGALVVYSGWKVVKRSGNILMEAAPPSLDVASIGDDLRKDIADVVDVHHVHAWFLSPDLPPLLTMHISSGDGADVERLMREVQTWLKERHGIEHATIQVEPGGCASRTCAPDERLSGLPAGQLHEPPGE